MTRTAIGKVLLAGHSHKGPFARLMQLCEGAGIETRIFHRSQSGIGMGAKTYAARFGEDMDFTAAGLHYVMRRNQIGRKKYLNPKSRFYNRLRAIADDAEKTLRDFQPDAVIVYHGYTIIPQLVLAKAAKLGIPALFFEPAIVPGGSFILDPEAPFFTSGGASMLEKDWPPAPLSAAQEKAASGFITSWQQNRKSKYYVAPDPEEQKKLDAFLARDSRPVALFALQVPGDMNVVFSLPASAKGHYENWVRDMIAACPPDWKIIIKPHPKSLFAPDYDSDRLLTLSRLNLHDLFARADAVITLSSNTGMEAVLAGKPAIVSNKVFYARKGLTLDCAEPGELPALLGRAKRFTIPEALRRQLVHHALLDYHFYPGETEKLLPRLARARVLPRTHPPLFDILSAHYKAAHAFIGAYRAQRAKGLAHKLALAAARAECPDLLWRAEFAPSFFAIIRHYWTRRFLVWRVPAIRLKRRPHA